ncbi:hypothetical protein LTR95_014419 [Oleoguttula sp. CCFEE 5521]
MRPSDQVFRMVEDEFLSTAKLYTRHLHREAYIEAKRRARASGGAMLRDLDRATDGRTGRGRRGDLEAEARERRKREKSQEAEEEREEWLDPQLAGLMKGREEARVVCRTSKGVGRKVAGVKGDTRAARGFGRSPGKIKKRDADMMWNGEDEAGPSQKRKQVEVEGNDSDDLDAMRSHTVPSKPAAKSAINKRLLAGSHLEAPTDIFKPYTKSSTSKSAMASTTTSSKTSRNNMPTPPTDQPSSPAPTTSKVKPIDPFSDDTHDLITNRAERDSVAEFLARKKAAREKKALGKGGGGFGSAKKGARVKDEEKLYDDVPTFMI